MIKTSDIIQSIIYMKSVVFTSFYSYELSKC